MYIFPIRYVLFYAKLSHYRNEILAVRLIAVPLPDPEHQFLEHSGISLAGPASAGLVFDEVAQPATAEAQGPCSSCCT